MHQDTNVQLGDEVEDKVSGFKGVAVSAHLYLNGCTRITVQPKIDNDGKLPAHETFDEPQLKVVNPAVAEEGDHVTGGPEKYTDMGRAEG